MYVSAVAGFSLFRDVCSEPPSGSCVPLCSPGKVKEGWKEGLRAAKKKEAHCVPQMSQHNYYDF